MKFAMIILMGGLGSLCRYLLGGWAQNAFDKTRVFPIGTLIVNLLGCLVIGLAGGALGAGRLSEQQRLGLMVGFLGGFTTFSSFGLETFNLLNDGEYLPAIVNIIISVLGGLALVWIGYRLSQHYLGA